MENKVLSLTDAIAQLTTEFSHQPLDEKNAWELLSQIKATAHDLETITSAPLADNLHYRRHTFWENHDGACLIGLAWTAGLQTHIHDHNHFGVVKCLQGQALSVNFSLLDDTTLKHTESLFIQQGQLVKVPPGKEFIHAMTTQPDCEITIDLHLYGPYIGDELPYRYDPLTPIDLDNLKPDETIPVSKNVDLIQLNQTQKENQ